MSVSGYSQKGGYPPSYPMTYPGSAPPTGGTMSTSFASPPSAYGGSRPNVYPTADTSMASLIPAASKTALNTDYTYPVIASVLCPVFGLMSMYHTHTARQNLKKGNKVRANEHIQKSNTYYGYGMCVGIAFWMFIIGVIFVIITHALINIKHYSVSEPGKFVNDM